MKKTLAALAVLGAFAGTAAAADVNLYGIIDTGLAYTYDKVTDGAKEDTFGMQSGYNSASRFGLKGTEELGNGLKVGFKLENGFTSDDGNFKYEDRLFGREASLSLMSEFGTISFGRMGGVASSAGTYDLVYSIADSFDGGDNDVLGLQISDRYDNMVTYQSPKFAGVQGTAQYSFKQNSVSGEGTEGTSKVDRYASLALTGDFGPLQLVGAYELSKYANTADEHDETHAFYVGGNYDLQVLKLFALAQYTKAGKNFGSYSDLLGALAPTAEGDEKGIDSYGLHLGTIVPVLGGDLTAGVYYVDGETDTLTNGSVQGSADMTYLGFSARYAYPLSKRTSVYFGAGYAEEKIDPSASITTFEDEYTHKIGQAYAGITHKF
ncbi:porin [Sutterella megalosphaeroides]|uniref:Porin n=1 Tax=Sutterella megalosphaeroides TaxID=2494234 RepID=A0A2Z6IAF1_9BURK|nr:porin [Sutterella megalosphaeroides]BBF23399.1 porin [Sutterella megalosphaeroides]